MPPPSGPTAPSGSSRRARAIRRGSRGVEPLFAVLARLVPLARRLHAGVRALTVASAVSIVVIVAVLLGHGLPGWWEGGALLVLVAVMAPVPIVLWLFHHALGEVLALPDWLRRSPEMMKAHGTELAGLVADARRSPSSRAASRRGGFLRDAVRAARLLLSAHDDLPGYGAVLRLASPLFLVAVVVALVASGFQIVLAASVVGVDVLIRLVG